MRIRSSYHWLLLVPGIGGLGTCLCPFAGLPVSQCGVCGLGAEAADSARAAAVCVGTALSDDLGRYLLLYVNVMV